MLIENSSWAYELSAYIHLNPLRVSGLGLDKRGRMLEGKGFRVPTSEESRDRLRELREFRWSSYRAYAGYCRVPDWLTCGVLLGRVRSEPPGQAAAYRRYIRQRLTQEIDPGHMERLRDVVAIGAAGYARKIREMAGQMNAEVTNRRELRKLARESDIRCAVEDVVGESLEEFRHKRGSAGRPLYLWAVRTYCGMTLREAGMPLGGMKPSAVDMAVKRWETKLKQDESAAELARHLEQRINAMWNVEG